MIAPSFEPPLPLSPPLPLPHGWSPVWPLLWPGGPSTACGHGGWAFFAAGGGGGGGGGLGFGGFVVGDGFGVG
jgi:hypothetical protein